MFSTYKPSGSFGAMTFPTLIISLALCAGLAYVYQLLLYWIPLIYVSFLLTIGFGFCVAMLGYVVVKAGHVRNPLLGAVIGIILGGCGIGAKFWWQYEAAVSAGTEELMKLAPIPDTKKSEARKQVKELMPFMDHIYARVESGWAIGGRGGGGLPLSGVFVYLVWLIEAGGVIGFAGILTKQVAGEPYSELLGKWASDENIVMTLPVTSEEMVNKILDSRSVDELLEIPIPKTDVSSQFAIYKVHGIEGHEKEDAYLTVNLTTISLDKNGNESKDEKDLVKYAILSAEQRDKLVENAELLYEAMEAYHQAKLAEQVEPANDEETEETS